MLFTDAQRNHFAKDPAVVRYHGTYFLYYTFLYDAQKIGVGIARSTDLERWEKAGELALEYPYEQKGIGAPAALVLHDQVHLFYQTYGNWRGDALCHAVSEDGLHFNRNPDNPIFSPTADWCCGRAIDADVCLFGGRLYLYFATRDHSMRIQKLGCAYADPASGLGRADWVQAMPQSILAPELLWEGECIEAPATVVQGDKVYLFYGGSYNCTPQQIGCAVSGDGVFFRRLFTEPFLSCGQPGSWNENESGHPYVFRDDDGRVYLFYQGSADNGKTWYLSRVEIGFDEKGLPFMCR